MLGCGLCFRVSTLELADEDRGRIGTVVALVWILVALASETIGKGDGK